MKKALSAIAFSCIAALSMTSLAACGSSHTHTYGDWVLTTTPSTTEHGVLTRTCSGDSSHTETKFMPYLNSTDYTVELVNATCTTDGYCTYTWKNTNYTINGAQIAITVYTGYEATGHSYTSEVTTAATCTEDGVMTYTCSSCGDTYTDAIPATGHSYTYTSMTWTATSNGYTAAATYTCANGHTTNVAATVSSSTTPATCTTDGKTVYTATVAAADSLTGVAITETKEVTIPATNHSYTYTGITWTETSNGYTAVANYVCANDGTHTATVTANVSSEKTESTCTTAGNITYTATVSASESLTGTAVSDTKVVALNKTDHTAGTAVRENEVAATCTTDASYDLVVYCTECDAEISRNHVVEDGTATGHTYALDANGWDWTEDAQNGGYTASASFTCSNDSSHTATVSATVTSETTPATCTEDGKIVYTATISAENSPTGEAVSDTKEVTIGKTGHSYTSEVTTAATCTEDGVKTYTCSACGDTYTETIPATGHNYEAVVTAPTCTEGGYTTYTCSACGDSYTADETEATGHSWDEGVVTTAATCTEDGVKTYTCSTCGETKTEAISATGHTAGEAVIENEKAATCTEAGSYDSVVYCTTCGAEISRDHVVETGTATGHSYALDENGWAWTEDAQNGGYTASASFTCSACGDTKTVSATVTSETTEATCTTDGKIVYTATISAENSPTGEAISDTKEVTIEATGHDYTSEVTKEATCTEDGVKTYTCSACSDTYTETIPATGHTAAEAVIENEKAATCTEDGSYDSVIYCSICGAEISRTTTTVHTYGTTLTYSNGSWYKTCTVCEDKVAVTENYSDYTFLADSADALSSALTIGGNILLTADISGNVIYTVANSVTTTLDLNGYTITTTIDSGITVEEGGSLTITDSTTGVGKIASTATNSSTSSSTSTSADSYTKIINNAGTLTVNAGTITSSSTFVINIYNTGTLNLNGGTITTSNTSTTMYFCGVYNDGGNVSANGTTINMSSAKKSYGIYSKNGTIEITTITMSAGTSATSSYNIYNGSSNTTTINDGDFSGYYNVYNYNTSSVLYIYGGTFSGVKAVYLNKGTATIGTQSPNNTNIKITNSSTSASAIEMKAGTLTIYSGTITSSSFNAILNSGGDLYVYDGIITGGSSKAAIWNTGSGTIGIYGGTLTGGNYGIYTSKGELIVNCGTNTIIGSSYGIYIAGSSASSTNTATITSGYISATGSASAAICATGNYAVVNIGSGSTDNSKININGTYAAMSVLNGATVNLYSATISGYTGISVVGKTSYVPTLNMYGGTVSSTSFAIYNNGSTDTTYGNINICGGTITSSGIAAIYLPAIDGITVISGTDESPVTISGTTGVEIRAGSLTISGNVSITATAEALSEQSNSNGSTILGGAAVAVSQHTTDKDITVVIEGGTFKGVYALYEKDLETTATNDGVIKITVSGGTFNGKVEANTTYGEGENAYSVLSITGGTYTTDVSTYVASGYTCSGSESSYTVTATNTEGE